MAHFKSLFLRRSRRYPNTNAAAGASAPRAPPSASPPTSAFVLPRFTRGNGVARLGGIGPPDDVGPSRPFTMHGPQLWPTRIRRGTKVVTYRLDRSFRCRRSEMRCSMTLEYVIRAVPPGGASVRAPGPQASPHFERQMTPKISRYTRCSMSICANFSINGRSRCSGQFGMCS